MKHYEDNRSNETPIEQEITSRDSSIIVLESTDHAIYFGTRLSDEDRASEREALSLSVGELNDD